MSVGVQYFEVSQDEEGQRLDNFLITRLKGAPKSLVYRVIRKGEVRVNKGRAKPERKLQVGDQVRVPPMRLAEAKEQHAPSAQLVDTLQQAILYNQDGLLIVNKPSGLAVHGGSGINLGLIESLRQLPGNKGFLELVHRLDRETSGCVMVAHKRSVLKFLQEALRQRGQIQKCYWALVQGAWPKHLTSVDVPLLRNEGLNGERFVRPHNDGKPSLTEFRVLQRFATTTLVEARPITGRTHQIRVHARHVGHPLVGDDKYGDDNFNRVMKSQGAKRLFLHAASLQLILPTGEPLFVEAPLPEDLARVLATLSAEQQPGDGQKGGRHAGDF